MKNSHDLILRQLNMLRMIPKFPQKITATQIVTRLEAEGFDVSKRTIERDLQGLSAVFPLISDERNKPFGWSWSADAPAIDLPGLTTSEALTLKLAEQYLTKLMPATMVNQLDPYFKAASKVLSSLEHESNLAKWPEKIAVVLPTQPLLAPTIDIMVSSKIEEGLLQEKQLILQYLNRDEIQSKTLMAHPLGIILRGQINYLVCTISDYQDIRLLAIHRISSAEVSVKSSNRPDGFKLAAYANSGALGFMNQGLSKIRLRFKRDAGLHLYETPLSDDQIITDAGEHLIIEATVMKTSQFDWWVNGFGKNVEVL